MKFRLRAETPLSEEEVRASKLFQEWLAAQQTPVEEVVVNAVGHWGDSVRMLQLCVKTGPVWELITLRKPTVDVLTIVTDGQRRCVVFVWQFRRALGRMVLSNPAGGIDDGESPEAAGVREVREELGLGEDVDINIERMISRACAATPGGINEVVFYLRAVIKTTPEEFDDFVAALDGKEAGLTEEGEKITLLTEDRDRALARVLAESVPDGKTLLSLTSDKPGR